MIVLVVDNGLLAQIPVETHLGFHLRYKFCVGTEFFCMKTEIIVFGLIELVKWMLANSFNINTFFRVSLENLSDYVFCV